MAPTSKGYLLPMTPDRFVPLRVKVINGYVHIIFDMKHKRIVKSCDLLHSEAIDWTECRIAKDWTVMRAVE